MNDQQRVEQGAVLTDEQRLAHVSALEAEKEGYEARLEAAKTRGDSDSEKVLEGRVKQVDEQIKIYSDEDTAPTGVENPDAKTPARRARNASRKRS